MGISPVTLLDSTEAFLYPAWPAPGNVRALTTTRAGGVSDAPYASLNLADHVGDDARAVQENRQRLYERASLPAEPLWLNQVHGIDVVEAAHANAGTRADGAYTNQTGVVCAVLTADCLPVFVCDQAGTEVALLHAGWRGLVAGVIEAGLRRFRAPASELLVWFGPAIGASAYEVGADVRDAFVAHERRAAEAFAPKTAGKWTMDIYRLARHRLEGWGVRAIYGGDHCTATQSGLFFSYRRDGATGRMASLIWLE